MKRTIFFLIGLITLALILYNQSDFLSTMYQRALLNLQNLENIPIVNSMRRDVNLPGPLKGGQDIESAFLTEEGVVEWTNIHRQRKGLPPLSENELLHQSAQEKLDDMFENQYFEHVSPSGVEPSTVIVSVGYEYITTGENLALGNFPDDEALVQGWMDSPGHRENILNTRYQEIGIAVGRGVYEGRETWMAVQHFGKPLASCPYPDESLKTHIDEMTQTAEALKQDIETRRQELENADPSTRSEAEEYNRKVDEYNNKVNEYNSLLEDIRAVADTYNTQIDAFNTCAQE